MAKADLTQQGIKLVEEAPSAPEPKDTDFNGVYRHNKDGLLYELAVMPADRDNALLKTHVLRIPPQKDKDGNVTHPGKSWHGTKDQFKEEFDKQ